MGYLEEQEDGSTVIVYPNEETDNTEGESKTDEDESAVHFLA